MEGIEVPFATIAVANTFTGTYSNEKGYFSLVCKTSDTLEVTAIGYKKEIIVDLKENLNVILSEQIELLNEIIVTPNTYRNKKISLGNFKNRSSGGFLGEYASMLKIDNQNKIQGDIIKVIIRLYKNRSGEKAFSGHLYFDKFEFKETLVRLLLFENKINNNDSLVSLLKSNITKKIKAKDKIVTFELDTLRIALPKNNVYVGIEMLGHYENAKFIPFNSENDISRVQQFRYEYSNKHRTPKSWTKHTIGSKWELLSTQSNGFFNFNYGIVVKEYKSP